MYPHAHNLGSRDWVSRERITEPPLGEWNGERIKYSGKPPLRVPLPILVGDAHCIEFGERPGLPVIADVSAACAKPSPDACFAAADLFLDLTDVLDCVFAKASVDIIGDAYEDLPTAVAAVTAFLGFFVGSVTSFEQFGESFPAGVIAKINDTAILWLTGTTNETQLAVQALHFHTPPVDQGEYSTTPLYEAAALFVADRLNEAGCGTCSRVILMGHSYGGAVCQVLAAKMTVAGPITRRIELLTFGASQPGDVRLHDLIAALRQTHYANERDPIPFLPPNRFVNGFIDPILFPVVTAIWSQFRRPPHIVLLTRTGAMVEAASDLLPDDTIFIAALLIAQGFEIPKFKDHSTDWYGYYLCKACQCVPRPCVEPPDNELVFEMEIVDLEVIQGGVPVIFNFANGRSNVNGLDVSGRTVWRWNTTHKVIDLSANEVYPGVYQSVILSFVADISNPGTLQFFWYFDDVLDVMNKGLTSADLPTFIYGPGSPVAVSLERLRITPILL